MKELCFGFCLGFCFIALIAIGTTIGLQHLYDTRQNKCVVSFADAISQRPEMVKLRKQCEETRS